MRERHIWWSEAEYLAVAREVAAQFPADRRFKRPSKREALTRAMKVLPEARRRPLLTSSHVGKLWNAVEKYTYGESDKPIRKIMNELESFLPISEKLKLRNPGQFM